MRSQRDSFTIRQPVYDLDERPFMIIWETTMACDLACRHCRAEAIPTADPLQLSTQEGKTLLDQIESFGKPRPLVILTGGDPFKRADLFDLVAYGTDIGLPVAVSPSATPLLTRENLARLKAAGAKTISLSLDGSTPAIHDDFRRVHGSYDLTIRGCHMAREVGLKLQINTTVTRRNLFDLPAIFRVVREHRVFTWSVFFLVPTGRGRAEDEISPAEYEDVMHWLYDASKLVSVKTTEGHHFKRVALQRKVLETLGHDPVETLQLGDTYRRLRADSQALTPAQAAERQPGDSRMRRTPMHINAGNGFVFISQRGDVFPSGFLPVSSGNVRQRSLVDIYRHAPMFRALRDPQQLEGRCGACEFRYVCGGSRSRAFAMTGNALAEEPFCTYEPHSFPYQAELQQLLESIARG